MRILSALQAIRGLWSVQPMQPSTSGSSDSAASHAWTCAAKPHSHTQGGDSAAVLPPSDGIPPRCRLLRHALLSAVRALLTRGQLADSHQRGQMARTLQPRDQYLQRWQDRA